MRLSQGGIRLDPFGYSHNMCDLDVNATVDLDGFQYRQHAVHGVGDVYDSPQHHWVAALQGRVELLPTAEIALNIMRILEGLYLSARLGRAVGAGEVDSGLAQAG